MTKETLDFIIAVGTLVNPIILLFLTGIGWHIKNKIEKGKTAEQNNQTRIKELEDKLREDRIDIYNQLLEPFFILFTTDTIFQNDPAYAGKTKEQASLGKMLTVEYRKIGFKLSLIANDSVVRAYNNLMQFFYKNTLGDGTNEDLLNKTSQWIKLLSDLLLEIRKSMGNEHTSLDNWEMIEWFMSEAEEMKDRFNLNPL